MAHVSGEQNIPTRLAFTVAQIWHTTGGSKNRVLSRVTKIKSDLYFPWSFVDGNCSTLGNVIL